MTILGEIRKGRRERIEKGSRERIEKIEKNEEKEGLRDPPFLEFSALRCSQSTEYDKLELKHQNVVFTSL